MNTLKNFDTVQDILCLIDKHILLFRSFNNIYLYGSILNIANKANDIDVLLIYSQYSHKIIEDINIIYSIFEKTYEIPLHLTVLSSKEEIDTDFLKRLNSKYLQLK